MEFPKILYENNKSEGIVERKGLEKNYTDTKTGSYVVQLGSSTLTLFKTTNCLCLLSEAQEILNQMKEMEEQKKLYNQLFDKKDRLASSEVGILVRGGSNNLLPDHERIDETLKESARSEKLVKNVVSKSVEDSGSLSDRSFNKIVLGVLDKLEPIIGNPKFLRVLA